MAEPKYLQIENDLKKLILDGKFEYGEKFYSETQLKEMYDVSSITVIRSVKDLVEAGYLVRYQGKGTFVAHVTHQRPVVVQELNVFSDKEADQPENIRVLSLEKNYDEDLNKRLRINKNTYHYHLVQIREIEETPYLYYQAYFLPKLINEKKIKELDRFQNIYLRIQDDTNTYLLDEPFKEKHRMVRAPKEVAEALKVDEGDWVIYQEKEVVSSKTGEMLLLLRNYKRPEYSEFTIATQDYPEFK